MKRILIITEKPRVAKKIAEYIFKKYSIKKYKIVKYYVASKNRNIYYIVPAIGHLFTLTSDEKGFPIFSFRWERVDKVEKKKYYAKYYIELFNSLKKKIDEVIIATDYDIEGELIGYNILKFCLNRNFARRMKFSEITPRALLSAFQNLQTINYNLAYAGMTRHVVDWLFGINISRLLQKIFNSKNLSAGRVQTPTLRIIYEREKEIESFVPKIYYKILLKTKYYIAEHIKEKFENYEEALRVKNNCSKIAVIERKTEKIEKILPPPPFNLTSLQTEAWRIFRISPAKTLRIAQLLYENGYISYPRTSSEKYPKDFNFKEILLSLSKIEKYKDYISRLLVKPLIPREGEKTDPAHPCIYPTGIVPGKLKRREAAIYHLIVRRFLATLSSPLVIKRIKLYIRCGKELFITEGIKILDKGWLEIYPSKLNYQYLPKLIPYQTPCQIVIKKCKTKPPERYTPGSLIKLMEELNLGTKSTRAEIIEKLYKRKYIRGYKIKITNLGKKVIEYLINFYPKITSVEMTRELEKKLEAIQFGKINYKDVINESIKILRELFYKNNNYERDF